MTTVNTEGLILEPSVPHLCGNIVSAKKKKKSTVTFNIIFLMFTFIGDVYFDFIVS